MKNTFSLVSTYISWSSLSLPTPRMKKLKKSCMVSAAHPLVTRRSYRLFRICSCRYVTKGVIIIGQPPLRGDRRYLRGGRSSLRWSSVCPAVRQQCFTMSSLKARHANSSVVGCKNQHKCLYSVPATEQKRRWLRFIFNDNVPATVCVLIAPHQIASVTRASTKLALPWHWPS